ncbi:MAG: NAD(P)-binding domain-containing protein, partial [Acidimicrobiales bacterium]
MIEFPSVAVLGTGSMGGAVLAGLLGTDVLIQDGIWTTNRSPASAALVPIHPNVTSMDTTNDPQANRIAVRNASIVIVAVKPYMIHDLLTEVHGDFRPDAIVVSVAAGVSLATLEELLPEFVVSLRAMSNTPAAIKMGVTGLTRGNRATVAQYELIKQVFLTVGEVVTVD